MSVHAKSVLFDNVAILAAAVVSNTIKFAITNPGKGERIKVKIAVHTPFAGGTSINFALKACATEGGTYVTQLTTRDFTLAELVLNNEGLVEFDVPSIGPTPVPACLEVVATPTGTFTGGTIDGYLDQDVF
jgi:hypothetical protein